VASRSGRAMNARWTPQASCRQHRGMEIRTVVRDLPPAKSEAHSLWAADHPKSQRV
jgi:hypothetical protein